ncbi:MAG: DUF262 domain-containing protein [Ardenticatenales bacterium]|nr:DUF262 domain-containing protein [Ardenticatenales bacterium]
MSNGEIEFSDGKTERITGQLLNQEWEVQAQHALYHELGTFYNPLQKFPGAYFDANGYILFQTEEEYTHNPALQIGKRVNIPSGIGSIPGYIQASTRIVDDEDTQEAETFESGSIYPYDMPKEVDIREDPHSVFEWLRKLKRELLIIDPEFQRKLVWKPKQKSLFIESVLLNIPLPPLYVNQSVSGQYIIVDGLQRTSTLQEFVNNEFALSELRVLKDLNNCTFNKLNAEYQTKIEDRKLLIYVIKPSVPLQMVYDIFHRINTGGTQLTRQEIRNCFYIGPATRLLKELAEHETFRKAIDNGIASTRMKDREAVLRFLAFRILDYKNDYNNDMDAFLGAAMERMNKMTDGELNHLREEFEEAMSLTYDFFGFKNFRLPTDTTRGRINIAILESVACFFAEKSKSFLQSNKEKIQRNFDALLSNPDYVDAVRISTGDTRRVIRRFNLTQKILGTV